MELKQNWMILQDVHDRGEITGLMGDQLELNTYSHLISDWEPLKALVHLQLVLADHPYYGRELRYFNAAPWWYRNAFTLSDIGGKRCVLSFECVDYYCKVYVNGQWVGEHEGYVDAFSFDITEAVREGENVLMVKVWSPWDREDREKLNRCFTVGRNMIKGTYEHADGFIQRDVNPVGIAGAVRVELYPDAYLREGLRAEAELMKDGLEGAIHLEVPVYGSEQGAQITAVARDALGVEVARHTAPARGDICALDLSIEQPGLWRPWDQGGPVLYTVTVQLAAAGRIADQRTVRVGFRSLRMERNETFTRLWLNEKPVYLRGASYFPDIYLSAMSEERYRRDLILLKEAGFNALRVHVHAERDVFYDLCDEMGFMVFQDSDFNWTHPVDDAFAERGGAIYRQLVRRLRNHASIALWIVLNEPWELVSELVGPKMLTVLEEEDPNRPFILSSIKAEDPLSGDSHNYLGSLNGEDTQYTDILGTTEKLNTEFGFDAPAVAQSLLKERKVFDRLKGITEDIPRIQEYQRQLIKYFIEHYRLQKYEPNAGYFQFMFIDLCPPELLWRRGLVGRVKARL